MGASRTIELFESDTRGVSEAVSQGIVFMIVIASASGVAIGGQELIAGAQDEASFEQAVTGFESLDKITQSFATNADEYIHFTANRQATLYSRNAELIEAPQDTEIRINDTSSSEPETEYRTSSVPFRVEHNEYTLTYDAGLMQSEEIENTSVLRTPADEHPASDNTLYLRTLRTQATANFHGGSRQFVLVSEDEPTTVLEASENDRITIRTYEGQGRMWEQYLQQQPYIDDVTSFSDTDSSETLIADFNDSVTIYHQQLLVEPRDRFTIT